MLECEDCGRETDALNRTRRGRFVCNDCYDNDYLPDEEED